MSTWYVHSPHIVVAHTYRAWAYIVCSCGMVYQSLIWRTNKDKVPRFFVYTYVLMEPADNKTNLL